MVAKTRRSDSMAADPPDTYVSTSSGSPRAPSGHAGGSSSMSPRCVCLFVQADSVQQSVVRKFNRHETYLQCCTRLYAEHDAALGPDIKSAGSRHREGRGPTHRAPGTDRESDTESAERDTEIATGWDGTRWGPDEWHAALAGGWHGVGDRDRWVAWLGLRAGFVAHGLARAGWWHGSAWGRRHGCRMGDAAICEQQVQLHC